MMDFPAAARAGQVGLGGSGNRGLQLRAGALMAAISPSRTFLPNSVLVPLCVQKFGWASRQNYHATRVRSPDACALVSVPFSALVETRFDVDFCLGLRLALDGRGDLQETLFAQSRVFSLRRQQLQMRPALNNAPALQDKDLVRAHDG